jgi:cytidylate kinase
VKIIKKIRSKNKIMLGGSFSLKIAVDGSSASGKSTGSKFISKKFKLKFLSSGKLYRYLAFKIIKNNNKYSKNFVKRISKNISLKKLDNKELYNSEVTKLSSIIAKKKYVRNYLKKFQTHFINKNKKLIIEGRDIGSKILPDADLKIFFTCSLQEKARRRLKEFKKMNKNYTIKNVKKALKLRDFSDKNRKESPLLFVKGAVLVDTTNLNIKQMEAKLTKLVNKKIKDKKYGNI